MSPKLTIDEDLYNQLLRAVGTYSRLFSESQTPFFHSRFVEKLYARASGAQDLSRKDMSFDAKDASNAGIGVKTFVASNLTGSKKEKIAEFPKNAGLGDFKFLPPRELAIKVSELRNLRVKSDAAEFGIDLNGSIYHCLIRVPGKCMVHEEPYSLIDIDKIRPVDQQLNTSRVWIAGNGSTYFTDGSSYYSFNGAKSVLMKRFDFTKGVNGSPVAISISEDIFESILQNTLIESLQIGGVDVKKSLNMQPFVVLPLYSIRGGSKSVSEKSGINQWMAGGRKRSFGEAYIPIPAKIHSMYPDFFPERDVVFTTDLPDGKTIQTKVCQDGRKALMSNPNTDLCDWLYRLIDGDLAIAEKRFSSSNPYSYQDLEAVGKDSVKITKTGKLHYKLEMMNLGAFEDFVEDQQL
jgi:hypothetical protein